MLNKDGLFWARLRLAVAIAYACFASLFMVYLLTDKPKIIESHECSKKA